MSIIAVDLAGDERHEGHDARALDRLGDDALVLHTGAATTAGHDFRGRGHEALHQADIFVVDFIQGIRTEVTVALFGSDGSFRAHTLKWNIFNIDLVFSWSRSWSTSFFRRLADRRWAIAFLIEHNQVIGHDLRSVFLHAGWVIP